MGGRRAKLLNKEKGFCDVISSSLPARQNWTEPGGTRVKHYGDICIYDFCVAMLFHILSGNAEILSFCLYSLVMEVGGRLNKAGLAKS